MRTTVDISDDLRARLKKLAAERGEKGYSDLINEALRQYLEKQENRSERLREVYELEGALNEDQANDLKATIEEAWNRWE